MDAATATVPILRPQIARYGYVFDSADTDTIGLIRELDRLLTLENANGYIFQASLHAYEHARLYTLTLSDLTGRSFPRPQFVPDGEGGIDIEWENGRKRLAISCRANPDQHDCIYWRDLDVGGYEAGDVRLSHILERLRWLASA